MSEPFDRHRSMPDATLEASTIRDLGRPSMIDAVLHGGPERNASGALQVGDPGFAVEAGRIARDVAQVQSRRPIHAFAKSPRIRHERRYHRP